MPPEALLPEPYEPPPGQLAGRIIVITGAGQGLGRAAALAVAALGATAVLLGRRQASLEATYDAIVERGGPEPALFPFDLEKAEEAGYAGLAQTLAKEFRRLDGIAHCAVHFAPLGPLATQSRKQWQALLATNLTAPFLLTQACLPLLKAAPAAGVVLVSETHGAAPAAYWGGFAVSKAGLNTLAQIWGAELASTSVRLNAWIPGPVATPQRRMSHPGESPASLPKVESVVPALAYLLAAGDGVPSGAVLRGPRLETV